VQNSWFPYLHWSVVFFVVSQAQIEHSKVLFSSEYKFKEKKIKVRAENKIRIIFIPYTETFYKVQV
tara:strand:- start:324 stop:521 length:198 start_codon:yes stop_codon:yes gene_type:complete